jgi:hypothetical protein
MFLGLLAVGLAAGCKKHAAPDRANATPPPDPSSTSAAPVLLPSGVGPNAALGGGDVNATLAQLTQQLRRTIARTRSMPTSFEDFVATAQMQVPPPPAGKKYAITQQGTVVLEDR